MRSVVRSVILALVLPLLLLPGAASALNEDPGWFLVGSEPSGLYWFIAAQASTKDAGATRDLTVHILEYLPRPNHPKKEPLITVNDYRVSCDWLSLARIGPVTLLYPTGEEKSRAVDGWAFPTVFPAVGSLGDQLVRQICGNRPVEAEQLPDALSAIHYAERRQPAKPPPPAAPTGPAVNTATWAGAYDPVSKSRSGNILLLDRSSLRRSGNEVSARTLLVLAGPKDDNDEAFAVRDVRFDCDKRTETLVESWQWAAKPGKLIHRDGGWTRALAALPFASPALDAACAAKPKTDGSYKTVAEAVAYARKESPTPGAAVPDGLDTSGLPADGRYLYFGDSPLAAKGGAVSMFYIVLTEDEQQNGQAVFWGVRVPVAPETRDGVTISYAATFWQIDCMRSRQRLLATMVYGLDDKLIGLPYLETGQWSQIARDTSAEDTMILACDPVRPRAEVGLGGLAAFRADYAKRRKGQLERRPL